jgi:hypothetical protein
MFRDQLIEKKVKNQLALMKAVPTEIKEIVVPNSIKLESNKEEELKEINSLINETFTQ